MDRMYEKFRTSQQPAVKLDIALDEGFREGAREEYGQYLRLRGRPAAEELIRREDTEKLEAMAKNGWFPGSQIDTLLGFAAEQRKNEAMLWLLQWKKENRGFARRDFSL